MCNNYNNNCDHICNFFKIYWCIIFWITKILYIVCELQQILRTVKISTLISSEDIKYVLFKWSQEKSQNLLGIGVCTLTNHACWNLKFNLFSFWFCCNSMWMNSSLVYLKLKSIKDEHLRKVPNFFYLEVIFISALFFNV